MIAGILLYTRVVGRVYYVVVADYSGIKINTRVAGVRAVGVGEGIGLVGRGGVLCVILSETKDLGDSTNPLTPRDILHCVQNDVFVAGILLYTREVGEVHYGVWGECLIARVLFLIPVTCWNA